MSRINQLLRAFLSGVPNVPNAKYLAHLTHQTQKQALISRSKSQKIWNMSTVPSQIWDGTDNNAITVWLYVIRFFSLLHHLSLSGSPSATHLSLSLCLAFSPRRLATPISPRRETETAQARHWSLTHFVTKRNSSVKDTVAGSENFHQRWRRRRLSWSDCRSWEVTNTEGGEKKKKGLCRFNF